MPLFAFKGEDTPITIDRRTKAFFAGFFLSGVGLSVYSIYQMTYSISFLHLFGFLTGLLISAGYAWLWKLIRKQTFHPTITEVHPAHLFLKKYNHTAKQYEEWTYPIEQIQIIIEKRLEPYRGAVYMVPALHLYDLSKDESRELHFDGDETMNRFLLALQDAGGEIRFLPYSLDYCAREERLKAFREESAAILFSGSISEYVPRNREAFFYSEQLEYKDILLKRRKE